jgi:hypothetical protein
MKQNFIKIDNIQYNINYCANLTKEAFLNGIKNAKESHYEIIQKLMKNDNSRYGREVKKPEHQRIGKRSGGTKKGGDKQSDKDSVGTTTYIG